jgi:hypothetical protein
METYMRRLLLSLTALAAFAVPAQADVILGGQNWTGTGTILTLSGAIPSGNQPRNIACIICGENQPQQPAGFGYNDFKNNGGLADMSSFSDGGSGRATLANDVVGVGYTVDAGSLFRLALLGRTDFSIGVDVNDTGTAQTLESFWFLNLTTHTVLAAFSPGPGGTPIPSINNGTGFPDYTLEGFNLDRGDIHVGDKVVFLARMSGMNDGPDSFFLTQSVQAVPELSTWAMMILGFFGIGGVTMLKRREGHPFRIA